MTKYQAYKNVISQFISSDKGQRFFNFAYSIGAAIVIWGALFKILHLPGGNTLLSIGMGTEVLMFVLTAFDRPPKDYNWEDVFPALRDKNAPGITGAIGGNVGGNVGGIVGGNANGNVVIAPGTANAADTSVVMPAADIATASQQYLGELNTLTEEMRQLQNTTAALNEVSSILLESYRTITQNSTGISESSRGYVDQMQALHHNLGGLNTIYELQLRSVSGQLEAIDRVNRGIKDIRDMYEKSASQSARYCEETEKMARYMQQLNSIYERMIKAMTVNMYRPGMTPPDINGMPVNNDLGHHNAPTQQPHTENNNMNL